MAQLFRNFELDTPSGAPAGMTVWFGGGTMVVIDSGLPNGVTYTQVLQLNRTGTRAAYTLDAVGSVSGDVEITAHIYSVQAVNISSVQRALAMYVSGSGGAENAYTAIAPRTSFKASSNKYVSGTGTSMGTGGAGSPITQAAWVRVRFQRTAVDDTLRVRYWLPADPEPGTWDIAVVDTSLTSGGAVGLFQAVLTETLYVDWIGVGTGGDAAPDAPLGVTGVGNLLNVNFETGNTSQWTAISGTPVVTATSPVEGAYSLLTTGNDYVSRSFPPQNAVYFMQEIQYTTYPASSTRNIAALRYSGGELISLRVTTSGQLRLQLGASVLYTAAGAMGTDPLAVLIYADRAAGLIELWTWNMLTDNAWTVAYSATGHSISNDFDTVRVGGLNSGHEGTHRTDYVQVGTNSDIVPHTYVPPSPGGQAPRSMHQHRMRRAA